MLLEYALHCLARVHTRDDEQVGFTVQTHPSNDPLCPQAEYVEAWKTVRDYIHLRTDPGQYPRLDEQKPTT